MTPISQKVFIIGLDGVNWQLLNRLFDRGVMPYLRTLVRHRAAYGTLLSTVPPVSAPAWASFQTGVNPGKHGVFGFTCVDAESRIRVVNSKSIRVPTMWDLFTTHNRESIVMCLPMNYPPRSVKGIIIGGLEVPDLSTEFTYPPEIKERILSEVPDFTPPFADDVDTWPEKTTEAIVDEMTKQVKAQTSVSRLLLTNYTWDVGAIHFQYTDYIQHFFWNKLMSDEAADSAEFDRLATFYAVLDGCIKEMIAHLPDSCFVFVVSDHGFQSHVKRVYINRWLKEKGYLEGAAYGKSLASFIRRSAPVRWGMKAMSRSLRKNIAARFGDDHTFFDRNQSNAFAIGENGYALVYILRQKKVMKKRLANELHDLRDPSTTALIINTIWDGESLYGHPLPPGAPDLVLKPNSGYVFHQGVRRGVQFIEAIDTARSFQKGVHHENGIFVAIHDSIARGKKPSAHITDIAPTIFYLLGLSVPRHLDGSPRVEWFSDGVVASHPVSFADYPSAQHVSPGAGSADDDARLKKRLQGLGYM